MKSGGYIALLLLLSACEKDFLVEGDSTTPKITINCNFVPWQQMRLYVTRSYTITGYRNISALPKARVEIYENDSLADIAVYQPYDTAVGYFQCAVYAQPGHLYRVRVIDPELGIATAEDKIPLRATVSGVQVNYPAVFNDTAQVSAQLDIQDVAGINNFYRLNAFYIGKRYNVNAPGDTTLTDWSTGIKVESLQGVSDTLRENWWTLYFSDADFKNGTAHLAFRGAALPLADFAELKLYIDVSTVSEAMYRYYTTLQQQRNAVSTGSSEPVNVYSNISGGYGIFAGYDNTQTEIIIK